MIEWALIVLAYICALTALGAVVFLILDYLRDPPRWWVRRQIPDTVPEDWGPKAPDVSRPRYSSDGGETWHPGPRLDPELMKMLEDNQTWEER